MMNMIKKHIKVLLVEDNEADIRIVCEYLKESSVSSFAITCVRCLTDGIQLIEKEKFDTVLLDLNLPGSSGLLNVDSIVKANPHLPIIVLTGNDNEEFGMEALHKGIQDYLIKGKIHADLLGRSILHAIERKHSQEQLRESQLRLKIALDSASIGIHEWNPVTGKIVWDDKIKAQWGLPADASVNYDIFMAGIHPDDRAETQEAVDRALDPQGRGKYYAEYRVVGLHDKVERWIAASGQVFFKDGWPVRLIGTTLDITERKRAEEILKRDKETMEQLVEKRTQELLSVLMELERTKRLSDIGMLAATVAHELRNPLAVIRVAAFNIKRKSNNPDIDIHLANIEKKITDSNQIINNLLFHSRIDTPHFEKVNIYESINEHLRMLENPEKDLTIIRELDPIKEIFIDADSLQMKELFSNLLNNACDAVRPKKGRITVKGAAESEYVMITLIDNGMGIDKEHLDKIFEPFFTTKAKGTGLGLAVCNQIVKLHSGTIRIKSKPTQGTTVTLCLPKVKKTAPSN